MITPQKKLEPFSHELKSMCVLRGRSFSGTAKAMGIPDPNLHFYLNGPYILPAKHFARLLNLCRFSAKKKEQLWAKYDCYARQKNPKSFKAVEGSHNFPLILKTTESPMSFIKAGLALCGQSAKLFNSVFDAGWRSFSVFGRDKFLELLEQIDWAQSDKAGYLKKGRDLYDRNFEMQSASLAENDNYKGILKISRLRSNIAVKELASELNISISLLYKNEDFKDDSIVSFNRMMQFIKI